MTPVEVADALLFAGVVSAVTLFIASLGGLLEFWLGRSDREVLRESRMVDLYLFAESVRLGEK